MQKCGYVLQGIGYRMLHHLQKEHAHDENDSEVEEVLGRSSIILKSFISKLFTKV